MPSSLRVDLTPQRAPVTNGARSNGPPRPAVAPSVDAINEHFHEAYERARLAATRNGPVFVMLADTLVLFQGAKREAFSFSPRVFHLIKSIAHAPVSLYAVLEPRSQRGLDAAAESQLRALHEYVCTSRARLQADHDAAALSASTRADLETVLDHTRDFAAGVLAKGSEHAGLDAWAGIMGPVLLRLIHDATRLQLEALHTQTEAVLRGLSESERASLQVVVTGDHQARSRSLGMQYFRKRLAEPAGLESRLTYGEGVADEQSALALVGTRRFDRALARSFFANELRLQRDILGDAAAKLLDSFEVKSIV